MFSALTGEKPEQIATRYSRYGELKADLAALVVGELEPIRARYLELRADPGTLEKIAHHGAEKASAVAGPVYRRAAAAMGLL